MDILIGLQWGDEGKGKIIDLICQNYDIVARFNGGANAGHTIYYKEKKVTLNLISSGIFFPETTNILGTGVALDPIILNEEILKLKSIDSKLKPEEKIIISEKAHLVLPTYKYFDQYYEESSHYPTIDTTKMGIAHTYSNKMLRSNPRVADIFSPDFKNDIEKTLFRQHNELSSFGKEIPEFKGMLEEYFKALDFLKKLNIQNTEFIINKAIKEGKKVLAEGAQATMLDIDYGTYPYVTSSSTIAAGACTGLGVSPRNINKIFGVTKAYCTRVGKGVFPTEINGEIADELREKGNEYGSNTNRPRRIGWLDIPALKYAIMINGITNIAITKMDILNGMDMIQVCTGYEIDGEIRDIASLDLQRVNSKPVFKDFNGWNKNFSDILDETSFPLELKQFIDFLESQLGVPVKYISTGPKREQVVICYDQQ
ncbi:MAG: adenylosuccinate synthase [Zunongwangia sp.]|uniref:Adenylosuccinate synthetase n=2 Tax=Zunongwangia profunda TaxID=398743 RepID=D5BBU8_ZUNPS|nr:adenylosuccinate synthase [Zunongwangia profunda]ADF52547.1 adenylosuccinate synthetase [Zunongwangia profunda SM-A87]MAO38139.1 adenylosuccinate synthase [Zunongwangia sp.]MAS70900.1 adenylosuccinate synthase [Zunongwangia sp.]HCV83023.1 adenylosuccinate synthase [Zunongwangia profunda]|tara:strand:+ start:289 stop:1569 length:1281 start_codon:yes stop_codon:yes gene_type:complete